MEIWWRYHKYNWHTSKYATKFPTWTLLKEDPRGCQLKKKHTTTTIKQIKKVHMHRNKDQVDKILSNTTIARKSEAVAQVKLFTIKNSTFRDSTHSFYITLLHQPRWNGQCHVNNPEGPPMWPPNQKSLQILILKIQVPIMLKD